MSITFNFLNNGPNGPTIYYDTGLGEVVSSSSPEVFPYNINISNPYSFPLYAQISGSVTLASGSSVVMNVDTVNLGEILPNSNKFFTVSNIYVSNGGNGTTENNGISEVETINITLNLYTDNGYSDLYESGNTSFRFVVFYDPTNVTIVNDFSGQSAPSLGFSGISSVSYVSSPVVPNGTTSIEVNSNLIPNGDFAYFNNSGGASGNNIYSFVEFYIYPTSTSSSLPGDQPFKLQDLTGITNNNVSYPYFYFPSPNQWYIIYLVSYGNAINLNGNYPSFTSSINGEYYIGGCQIWESTTNFL